jgi:hypothetical protein
MNLKKIHIAFFSAVLLTGVVTVAPAQAAEEAPVQIPATTVAIWQAIDQHTAALDKLIQAGTLQDVHHHAFAIRDLSAALPARVAAMAPDKRKQLESDVKYVATLAQRLDASGDANDRAGAESNQTRLKSVLATLRTLSTAQVSK